MKLGSPWSYFRVLLLIDARQINMLKTHEAKKYMEQRLSPWNCTANGGRLIPYYYYILVGLSIEQAHTAR